LEEWDDDGEWETCQVHWDEDEECDSDWWGPQYTQATGPLGLLNVAPPLAPQLSSVGLCDFGEPAVQRSPITLICQAPELFRCAIDGRICQSAVRTGDGILYEKSSILSWLAWNKVCPVIGSPLTPSELYEDPTYSESISSWLANLT